MALSFVNLIMPFVGEVKEKGIAPSPLALGTSFFAVIVFCMFEGFLLIF